MKTSIKRWITAALCCTMCLGQLPMVGAADYTQVIADTTNLARDKDVVASGQEVPDRFAPELAVDGIVSKDSRWSPDKDITQRPHEATLQVDLKSVYTIEQITIRFESEPHKYEVLVSETGAESDFTPIEQVTSTSEGKPIDKKFVFAPQRVQFIKYRQLEQWKHSNGKYYGGSIYELEAYEKETHTTAEVVDRLAAPTIAPDGKSVVLPEAEGYIVSLYGSDNEQVLHSNNTIYTPLADTEVKVVYKVVNKTDPDDTATSTKDVTFTIPGSTKPEAGDNAKPNVIPSLREWKGGQGNFTLTDTSALVLRTEDNDALADTATLIQKYFKEMLGRDIGVRTGNPQNGDIVLKLDASLDYLTDEGYTLDADDILTIASSDAQGVLYGGASLTQVLYQDAAHINFPKGRAHDYPAYPIRSGMLDVGRMYIPLEYVQEMAMYMGWFKLNEIHMHINDYWGKSGYQAFRLESTTYPQIVAKDGHYTKAEYKQFQKDLEKYGIDVITEIDSPYHAECFRDIPGVPMLKAGSLDITTDEKYQKSIKVIKDLMDEYLDGPDPVFQGKRFHIGTDEYDKKYSEQMRKWTDELIRYSNSKGCDTRVWGSLGSRGFNGATQVSKDAIVDLWAPYWADVKETYADGWDVVNTCGGWLYIVPRGNAGYPDRLNLSDLYEKFEVNNFAPSRNYGQGTAIMPVAHPQTKGAQFCVWNDMTSFRGGYSEFDIFDRFKNAVAIVSEKTWYGEREADQTGAEFQERFAKVSSHAPGANPGRWVASKSDLVIDLPLTEDAQDVSGNDYHANLSGKTAFAEVDGQKALVLTDGGKMTLPMESLGYPYTANMMLRLDAEPEANTLLFSSEDGEFYANVDGTGHPGFKRGYDDGTQYVGYTFVFENTTLPIGKWFTLALTSKSGEGEPNSNIAGATSLYIDGAAQGKPVMTDESRNNGFQSFNQNDSSTSVLPLATVGENLKGAMAGLKVYNRVLSDQEISDLVPEDLRPVECVNVARDKDATASSSYPNKPWTPDKTLDGGKSGDSRWSSKRATGTGSNTDDGEHGTKEQWIEIDLQQEYYLDEVKLFWEAAYATKYDLLVAGEDKQYTVFKSEGNGNGAEDIIGDLKGKKVRYLKVLCKEAKTAQYGYSLYEIEAYELVNAKLLHAIANAQKELDKLNIGNQTGQVDEKVVAEYRAELKELETLAYGSNMTAKKLNELVKQVNERLEVVKFSIIEGGSSSGYTSYTLEFVTNGGSAIQSIRQVAGSTIRLDSYIPVRAGYDFAGWYSDAALINKVTEVKLNTNKTVYAKWTKGEVVSDLPFADVRTDTWYYEAVKYAYENDLMDGITATIFAPNEHLNRAMLAQILYNEAGRPAVQEKGKFSDVPANAWYADAVSWAAAEGIVTGVGANKFAPSAKITREQVTIMLYRAAGTPAVGETSFTFSDADKISTYALDAMHWAVSEKIIQGNADGTLNPRGNATRAEIAQVMMGYLENVDA